MSMDRDIHRDTMSREMSRGTDVQENLHLEFENSDK